MSTQPQQKGRLVSHFENRTSKAQNNSGWSELWESNESGLWDRGVPSPALIDLVEGQQQEREREQQSGRLFSSALAPANGTGKGAATDSHQRRLKALVPGCGRGYDVVALALHGFDAYGLEVSQRAVNQAGSYVKSELADPHDYNFSEPEKKPRYAASIPGEAKILMGDFFETGWEEVCFEADSHTTGFDLIYDYTFLCAIHPTMRLNWARRMKELLSPSGVLVCLEFPLYKDVDAPGPPYGVKDVHWNLLAEGGNGIVGKNQFRNQSSHESSEQRQEKCLERIAHYKPRRTYEVGKDTDMISVWKHVH